MSTSVEVTYLYHSGYMVSVKDTLLVFDYYSGSPEEEQNFDFVKKRIESDGINRIVFFASHGHRDHYDKKIFTFNTGNKKRHFLLSNDIQIDEDNITKVRPYDKIAVDDITVSAFGSTDEGVSFFVNLYGVTIFHAGDLNWWHWFYESTQEELKEYETDYKNEIIKIEGLSIAVAMFPVDPRLREFFWKGGAYFIEKVHPKHFFPMHFGIEYEMTETFKDMINDRNIYAVGFQRQVFYLDITA